MYIPRSTSGPPSQTLEMRPRKMHHKNLLEKSLLSIKVGKSPRYIILEAE